MINKKGFSLLELIIALSILAIVFGALYNLLSFFTTTWDHSYSSAQTQKKLLHTTSILFEDLFNAKHIKIIKEKPLHVIINKRITYYTHKDINNKYSLIKANTAIKNRDSSAGVVLIRDNLSPKTSIFKNNNNTFRFFIETKNNLATTSISKIVQPRNLNNVKK
jgi:prepilin-type N-terminal cleavage/methylation domain-containing protein